MIATPGSEAACVILQTRFCLFLMHASYLPGYPASHGCVRLPEEKAIAIFNAIDVGTPVTVFGRTPRGREIHEVRLQQRPRGTCLA